MKYLTILLLFFSVYLGAQNISVQSFQQLPDDMDARVSHSKKDQNGDICAIIKVETTEQGFSFEGDMNGIVSTGQKIGEYWVYVPHGSKSITVMHSNLGIMRSYAYPVPIKEALVYEMKLTTGKVITTVVDHVIHTEWVVIESEPDTAHIFINDEFRGTTPYQQEYEEGTYTYRIEYPMYHSSAGRFEVSKAIGKVEKDIKLDPNYGSISVSSQPENRAAVLLDGSPTGKTTPCRLERISSEKHTISLQHEWYEPIRQVVTVEDARTSDLMITMKPTFSNVKVTAEHNAEIYVDGARKANSTWQGRLRSGFHTFEAKRDKYYPDQSKSEIHAGEDKNINLQIRPIEGTLKVISQPIGAKISLNGKDYGTTPITINNLLIGTYSLTLQKESFGTINMAVSVTVNQTTEVSESLPSGRSITIESVPARLRFYIDGEYIGETPKTFTIGYGRHSIKIENGRRVLEENLNIIQGDTRELYKYNVREGREVLINSSPSDADIYINGEFKGRTPFKADLIPGTFDLLLRKSNYRTLETKFSFIDAEYAFQKTYTLDSETKTLRVNSGSDIANVHMGGRIVGQTNENIEIEAGSIHSLHVKSPSIASYRKKISTDEDISLDVSLYPKSALIVGGDLQYYGQYRSFGYGVNAGINYGHLFVNVGGGFIGSGNDDYEVDITKRNVQSLSSTNYTQVGKFYDGATGGALYAKGGFLIYSPFTFIVSAGLAYTISPEFQYIYRANETMTTGLFIGLNNGDYFTKAEVTYFNSTFFIMGISVPLVDNTIIIGADLWFGAERETIFGINIQLPFDIAEYF